MPTRPTSRQWLSRAEAAEYTGFSKSTIRRAAQKHELPEGGTDGKRMYQRRWLDTWLSKRAADLVVVLVALLVANAVGCRIDAAHDVMRQLHLPCLFAPTK